MSHLSLQLKIPHKLWNCHKGSLCHLHICGCLAHVLKTKTNKMGSGSEACFFVGYPKGMKDSFFYSPKDNKVFVSTNATFSEKDYIRITNQKVK